MIRFELLQQQVSVGLAIDLSFWHSLIIFKENYRSLGNYSWEDDAYVEFKRNEREKLKYEAYLDKDHYYKLKIKIFLSSLIDRIGCYGTNPTRVALSMLAVFMLFAGLFTLCFLPDIQAGSNEIHWWTGLYFSGITFLTIGYGVVSPLGAISSALAVIEGFLGMFLMSYFSVAVVRKTLR